MQKFAKIIMGKDRNRLGRLEPKMQIEMQMPLPLQLQLKNFIVAAIYYYYYLFILPFVANTQ